MLFGEFLLREGAVDEAALLGALDEQQRRRPFLGTLAVREGALSAGDVLRVLRAQVDERRSFGAHAVSLGLLTDARLDALLALQRSHVPPIGEVLVERNAIAPESLQESLQRYFRLSRGR